jgi:hypothetical protein
VGGGWRLGGSPAKRTRVASVIWATASSKAGAVAAEVDCTPLTLRTYWRAAASISSGVASGDRPRSVVILRHMPTGYDDRRVTVLNRCPPSDLMHWFAFGANATTEGGVRTSHAA